MVWHLCFVSLLNSKLEVGRRFSFSRMCGLGNPFMKVFHKFIASLRKEAIVADCWVYINETWNWAFGEAPLVARSKLGLLWLANWMLFAWGKVDLFGAFSSRTLLLKFDGNRSTFRHTTTDSIWKFKILKVKVFSCCVSHKLWYSKCDAKEMLFDCFKPVIVRVILRSYFSALLSCLAMLDLPLQRFWDCHLHPSLCEWMIVWSHK